MQQLCIGAVNNGVRLSYLKEIIDYSINCLGHCRGQQRDGRAL